MDGTTPPAPSRSALRTLGEGILLMVVLFALLLAICFGLIAAVVHAIAFAIGASAPDLRWITSLFVVPLAYGLSLLIWVPRMNVRAPDHPLLVRRTAEVMFVAGMIGFGLLLKRL